jgi:hypothetical protein
MHWMTIICVVMKTYKFKELLSRIHWHMYEKQEQVSMNGWKLEGCLKEAVLQISFLEIQPSILGGTYYIYF